MAVVTPLSASQAQQAPSTSTLAEIQRKASLGIPLTDQSNTANNALYNSFKPVPASGAVSNDTNVPKGLNLIAQPSASQQSFFSGASKGTPWAAAPTNLGGVAASAVSSALSPPSSGGNTPPKFDAAGIAASRVAAQRAALASSVNAYDTSRKSAYDYAQGTTQGNRALLQFDNSNRGDQFGGSAREDLFRLQRSQGIEDTAANTQYNNDIAAENQKLADFDAGAPGMTSDLENQLNQQNQASTLALNQDNRAQSAQDFSQGLQTNQFNSQQQNQNFNQNLQTNQYNQSAQNQQFNQNLDAQKLQQAGQQFAAQNKLDWTKLSLDQQNQLSQIAISQQNANTSAAGQANTAANDAARMKLDQGNQDLANANAYGTPNAQGQQTADYLYKQSQAARDSALAIKAGQDGQKNAIDTAYKDAVAMVQKDPMYASMTDDQKTAAIDSYYQRLKPTAAPTVSDSDISSYLNK